MDDLAYRLAYLSSFKLQCESALVDPNFPKLIGHYSVYQKAAQYVAEQDDFIFRDTSVDKKVDSDVMEDLDRGMLDEKEHAYTSFLTSSSPDVLAQEDDIHLHGNHSINVSESEVNEDNEDEHSSDEEESDFSYVGDSFSDSSVEEIEDLQDDLAHSMTLCDTPVPQFSRPRA